MDSPSVQLTLPSWSLFAFPPSNDPRTLPPPTPGSTQYAPPFAIPPGLYNAALDARVPIGIACAYAVTVKVLNAYNRSNGYKPWAISKTKIFFAFVMAHNIFLAVYSGWTFIGMLGALQRVFVGWNTSTGFAGSVDSLCKIHGASGLGNAVAYNPSVSRWESESPTTVLLDATGLPSSTDSGRMWNEALAFYGWFFYLSKFYEVFDTLIILAKGKKSSTLQTYHHAGAMMCMWAGIRYMSSPIWLFAFLNSAIHTLMYTYYTLTALSIRVPIVVKQTLTTMQIVQFLVGVPYAAIYPFITYEIPIKVLDMETNLKHVAAASSAAAAATSAGITDLLKTYLFRAAGEQGLAQNANEASPIESVQAIPTSQTIQYRTIYRTISCVDTSGQTFAIMLNVLYLLPLTVLFMKFFIKSYLRRTGHAGGKVVRHVTQREAGEKSVQDALKAMDRELYQHGDGNAKDNLGANGNGSLDGRASEKY